MAKVKISEGESKTVWAGGAEGLVICNDGGGVLELNTADPLTAGGAVQLESGDSFIAEPGSVWAAAEWIGYSARGCTAVVTTV